MPQTKEEAREQGRRGAEKRWGAAAPGGEGPVDLLAEMEGVLSRGRSQDVTDLQRKLRKLYEGDFEKFMDRLVKLRGKPGGKGQEEGEGDEGTAAALGCAEAFLREWGQ